MLFPPIKARSPCFNVKAKLNISNIYGFGFNAIFPGNLASSTIPVLCNSKTLECDMLVIKTSDFGNMTF